MIVYHTFGWKTPFDGIQPLMEDNLQWFMTFDGRHILMADNQIPKIEQVTGILGSQP